MVNITIDHQQISVPQGTSILNAATLAGIPIPKLCYLKEINEIGACRICVVEIEGKEKLVTSCNNVVEEGMVIYTNSAKVRKNRVRTVQMILSQHDCSCVTCSRSGNCTLQKIANELHILDIPYEKHIEHIPWNKKFPLIKDAEKCVKCMRCVQVCDKIQGMGIWDLEGTGSRTTVNVTDNRKIENTDCTLCGQCITHCPVGALRERDDVEKAWIALENPKVTTIVQVAPAVRAAWGEELGLARDEATMGKIADALKRIGFDYVFDTVFSADLTIMEEGTEFVSRYLAGDTRQKPMFTSCCPGWVRFLKSQYPHLTNRLSTAKSPQQMFGAVMKSFYAKQKGIAPENIVTVSIMPCVAKKGEAEMPLFHEEYAGKDVDIVLTTREFNHMMRTAHINPLTLKERKCDEILQDATGAGVIFGATGGVMEAALRSAYYLIKGENPDPESFKEVRGKAYEKGWMQNTYTIDHHVIETAVVSGLANTRALMEEIEAGKVHYDFVEVMACPGGCSGGGGQPIHDGEELAILRGQTLYQLDKAAQVRFSHENMDIQKMYQEYFEKPGSHKAHMLLHTDHFAWNMPDKS